MHRWIVYLLISLMASPVLAQDSASATQPEKGSGQEQTAKTSSSDSKSDAAETAATKQTTDDSPYDYRSSEEISEDRSVSFPVDI